MQYQIEQNIEIKELAFRAVQNIADALMQFGEKHGVRILSIDTDVIHRVPGKDKKMPNVRAKLASPSRRSRKPQAVKI